MTDGETFQLVHQLVKFWFLFEKRSWIEVELLLKKPLNACQ
jgi:hypothetical protein